jgi:hypothetical protein
MKITMYTQSNAYVRKLSSWTILTLLLVSALLMVLPVMQVHGSTGHPTLGVTNTYATQPATYTAGTTYVNVTAGSNAAMTDGSTSGYFAIDFGTFGGAQLVTFSGAQFSLYLSKDGLAQISSTDIKYAGPSLFSVSDLTTNSGWHAITETNGTFYIGQTTGGDEVITGPIPIKISNDYKFIKIYDGSTTSVAVSAQAIFIQPGLTLTPSAGPAGTAVTAFGGGFPSSKVIDLVFSYAFINWQGVTSFPIGNWTTGVNTGSGFFSYTAPMIDSKQAYNPLSSSVQPISYINILAKYQSTPHYVLAAATFDEYTRTFTGVVTYNAGKGVLDNDNVPAYGPYGNDSNYGEGLIGLMQPIGANVLGTINIAGNHSVVNSPVQFWIGSTEIGSTTTNGYGYYNATLPIPILPAGNIVLKVINNGVTYEFTIDILPTLVLTPSNGTVTTHVTAAAYGFPANSMFYIYWYQYSYYTYNWYQVAHGTTGADGTFNVTVAFNVPHAYGGPHDVAATNANFSVSSDYPPGITTATTTFTVTATLVVCNGTTCKTGMTNANMVSINANTRTMLSAVGTGLYPDDSYYVALDNAYYAYFYSSYTGDTYVNFTAAGFAPGLHQVDLLSEDYCSIGYCGTPLAWAYFNVTTTGAYYGTGTGGLPTSVIKTINDINSTVNAIFGWQSTITSMNTNIGTINSNVATILTWGSTITAINTHVTTILGWQSTIVSINSTVNGLKSTLATMTGTLQTIIGDITSATNAATAAKTSADAASAAATNAKTSVSDTTTYVLVVAVLAAITLVLELAILVRKLD